MKQLRLFKMMLLMCLLLSGISNAWGEVKTATLDLTKKNLESPVEIEGVTFQWNSSFIVGSSSNGFKNGARLTVTIPTGTKLVKIAKTNPSMWGSNASVNVYAGNSVNGTQITSLEYATNEYPISSNNTGSSYYFANQTSANAWVSTLSITYEVENGSNNGSIVINAAKISDFTATYKEYDWSDSNVNGKIYAYKSGSGTSSSPYLMQFNGTPYCYNTTAIPGRITSVTITKGGGTSRDWNVYVSNSLITSSDNATATALSEDFVPVGEEGYTFDVESGDYTFFYIKKGTGATQISEIVINYEAGSPSTSEEYSYSLETIGEGNVVFKDASNNIIEPGEKVAKNTKITPIFTPVTGFEFSKWEYYGISNGVEQWKLVNGDVFTITRDVDFRVTFIATVPEFDVEEGTYTEEQTIHVENYNSNIRYFYTVDDTDPDCSGSFIPSGTSLEYGNSAGIIISSTTTLKMIAVDANGNKSDVKSATYTITEPEKTPASFKYTVHAKVGSQFQGLTFSNNLGASATYSSSNTSVATVDAETGKVTVVGKGEADITYTVIESEYVNERSQSYRIMVTE